jgi:AraC-like DNA-binding protein
MPQSSHTVFTDPFPYQRAIRAAEVETVVTSRGKFAAELTKIDLDKLWMQRGSESLAQTSHSANSNERAPVVFLTDPDQGEMHHSGMPVSFGDLVVYSNSATHYRWTSGATRWASMSLTPGELAHAGRTLAGREIEMPAMTQRVRPSAPLVLRLAKLHHAAGELARNAPDVLAKPEVARSLEHELVTTMVQCLTEGAAVSLRPAERQHRTIIGRFEELLAANRDRPLYLAEICQAVGASERTLRNCCHEHFGFGPIRYLWLRRMYLARRALLFANPATASVTEIALDHGFWELGRFAIAYKALFGEAPLVSLRREPKTNSRENSDPFVLPVSESA